MKISVIIPTKNSEKTIERCLKSIKCQNFRDFEIIVIDNFSKDNTVRIAKKFAIVHKKGPERSSQRNFGAKKAKGKFILFIDSDMELTPDVLKNCYENSKKYRTLFIPERFIGDNLWGKAKALEKNCYLYDESLAATRFFEKKLFLETGGYDEKLTAAEDFDLTNRIRRKNIKIGWCREFIIHHDGSPKFFDIIRKKAYYAKSFKKYLEKNPEEAKKQMQFIRPAFLRNINLLLAHPILTLALFYLRLGESMAAAWSMIWKKH